MSGQQRDRVLVLGARPRDCRLIGLGGAERRLGLRDVLLGIDPESVERLREPQRFLIPRDGLREERVERVLSAQLEVRPLPANTVLPASTSRSPMRPPIGAAM